MTYETTTTDVSYPICPPTRASVSITELTKALSAAQAAMPDAAFDHTNPHYKSKYASLSSVRAAVKDGLAKHGLAVTQVTDLLEIGDTTHFVLITRLSHTSGEWQESIYPLAIGKPQEIGSALTYARRYTLAAICAIASDEDDDGEAAQKSTSNPNERLRQCVKPPEPPKGGKVTGKERVAKHGREYWGEQWDPTIKQDREKLFKLCMEVIGREPTQHEPLTEAELHRLADDMKAKLAAREERYMREEQIDDADVPF